MSANQRAARGKGQREVICLCNDVSLDTIQQSIRDGADTLNKIFDATCAGVGPCGGSCRRKLGPMLDQYMASGVFPESTGRVSKPKR